MSKKKSESIYQRIRKGKTEFQVYESLYAKLENNLKKEEEQIRKEKKES